MNKRKGDACVEGCDIRTSTAMILCNGGFCDSNGWYHYVCVGMDQTKVEALRGRPWFCQICEITFEKLRQLPTKPHRVLNVIAAAAAARDRARFDSRDAAATDLYQGTPEEIDFPVNNDELSFCPITSITQLLIDELLKGLDPIGCAYSSTYYSSTDTTAAAASAAAVAAAIVTEFSTASAD